MRVLLTGILVPLLAVVAANAQGDDDAVFMWSSTGGGWRAMFACVGFANLFQGFGFRVVESKPHPQDGGLPLVHVFEHLHHVLPL